MSLGALNFATSSSVLLAASTGTQGFLNQPIAEQSPIEFTDINGTEIVIERSDPPEIALRQNELERIMAGLSARDTRQGDLVWVPASIGRAETTYVEKALRQRLQHRYADAEVVTLNLENIEQADFVQRLKLYNEGRPPHYLILRHAHLMAQWPERSLAMVSALHLLLTHIEHASLIYLLGDGSSSMDRMILHEMLDFGAFGLATTIVPFEAKRFSLRQVLELMASCDREGHFSPQDRRIYAEYLFEAIPPLSAFWDELVAIDQYNNVNALLAGARAALYDFSGEERFRTRELTV